MKNIHHKIQAGIVSWYDFVHGDGMLIAIPNGGKRDAISGALLKAEGVRAGVWDMFLARPTKVKKDTSDDPMWMLAAGLWLEVKRPDQRTQARGGLTVAQDYFGAMARLKGYETAVAYTTQEGIDTITKYLGDTTGRR